MITKDDSHIKNHKEDNASDIFNTPNSENYSLTGVFKRKSIRPSSSIKRSMFRVKSISSRRITPGLKNDLVKDINLQG